MNVMRHAIMAGLGLGLALAANGQATAATGHYVSSNAINHCQAFTPGISNTIRNRVTGAQNVGTASIAVACAFNMTQIYGGGSGTAETVEIAFKNDSAATVTVNCTLLPGDFWNGLGDAVSNSVDVAAGDQESVSFSGSWAVFGIGVNCNLPPKVTITQTVLRYSSDG